MARGRRRQKRHNDCRGKTRYGSPAEAAEEQPAMFPYECKKCGCWHLTSKVSK